MKTIKETLTNSVSEVAKQPLKQLNSSQHAKQASHFSMHLLQVGLSCSIKGPVMDSSFFGYYLSKDYSDHYPAMLKPYVCPCILDKCPLSPRSRMWDLGNVLWIFFNVAHPSAWIHELTCLISVLRLTPPRIFSHIWNDTPTWLRWYCETLKDAMQEILFIVWASRMNSTDLGFSQAFHMENLVT